MKKNFDDELLSYTQKFRTGYTYLLSNLGKITAIFTAVVTSLLVFTNIEFLGFDSKEFSTTLILVLISTYVCYFSLEEAGERLYEGSEDYQKILADYRSAAEKIKVEMLGDFREYLSSYMEQELRFRQGQMLLSVGLTREDLENFIAGKTTPKENIKKLKKIAKAKRLELSPEGLLAATAKTENAKNPMKTKYPSLLLRMIPSTFWMIFTVSVVLTFKEMTPENIIEAVIKLSTIPIASFRGYAGGYNYKMNEETPYIESKTRLLRGFLDSIEK